jgi:hypothetical protein
MPSTFCLACGEQTPEQLMIIFRHLNQPNIEASAIIEMCAGCARTKMPWFRAVRSEGRMVVVQLDRHQQERSVEG